MKAEQFAVNTVSLRGDLPAILAGCAEAGFTNVELALSQVYEFFGAGGTPKRLQTLLRERELQLIGGFELNLQAFSDAESQHANHARHLENAHLLAQLGNGQTQNMVVGTDGCDIASVERPLERLAEVVAQLSEQIAPLGVNLLIEFNWGAVKTLPAAAWIARQSGAPNAGVLFDPAHFYCTPTKREDLTPENVAQIRHVHVNNMSRKPAELSNCNSDRLLPDDPEGALNIRALFDHLESLGYNGYFCIEMFSESLWALPPIETARRLRRSFDRLL